MRGRLWSMDDHGEPWLGDASENPYVMLANPKRRHGKPRKGIMPLALARYWATHRRKSAARKNPARASRAVVVHRASPSRPKATWLRKNPGTGGGSRGFLSRFPDMGTIGGVTLGFAAPGIIAAQVNRFLPTSITSSPTGAWVVKAAAAILPPLLLKKLGQTKLGMNMLIGGVVSIAVDVLRQYFPTYMSGMGAQPMLGYYTPGQLPAGSGARYPGSNGMGMYTPDAYPRASSLPPAISTVPGRLSPTDRF